MVILYGTDNEKIKLVGMTLTFNHIIYTNGLRALRSPNKQASIIDQFNFNEDQRRGSKGSRCIPNKFSTLESKIQELGRK